MAKQSTIVLLDMAPIHCAAELCAKVKTNMPDLHLIFVPSGCTAWCQPLDIAYMRSFKAHLCSAATRAYASEIMQGLDLQGRILKKPELRIQLISLHCLGGGMHACCGEVRVRVGAFLCH